MALSVFFFSVEDIANSGFKELLEAFEDELLIGPFASFLRNILDVIGTEHGHQDTLFVHDTVLSLRRLIYTGRHCLRFLNLPRITTRSTDGAASTRSLTTFIIFRCCVDGWVISV